MKFSVVAVQLVLCALYYVVANETIDEKYGIPRESVEELENVFGLADKETEGELTKQETWLQFMEPFEEIPNVVREEMFAQADADCNGSLNKEEFLQFMASMIKAIIRARPELFRDLGLPME